MIKFNTIGSDPEFFVLDPNKKPYPANKFAIGSKECPSPINILGEGYFEQRDNISLEGNVPVAKTKEEFIENITKLRNYFIDKVSKFGYSISSNGVEYFEKRYLKLPEAQDFGCSSVISSWDSNINQFLNRRTPNLGHVRFRVSGFHIHIGYDFELEEKTSTLTRDCYNILIGRLFDLFLTIPSQIIKPEPERIQTYGKYGMIRSKSYGVECRTLSTYFTQEEQLPWVWDQLKKIELFINNLSYQSKVLIIKDAYFIGTSDKHIYNIFNTIFSYIEEFDKLKEIFEELKIIKKN